MKVITSYHGEGKLYTKVFVASVCSVYYLYYRLSRSQDSGRKMVSEQYTPTGYHRVDCNIPVMVFVCTVAFALLKACIL